MVFKIWIAICGVHVAIGADFLGALGANAPREKTVVGAVHPEEFGP